MVLDHRRDGVHPELLIRWQVSSGHQEWVRLEDLACGFKLGQWVRDVPRSRGRSSLGAGEIVELRRLAEREQALVEFPTDDERRWIPFEHLALFKSVREGVYRGDLEQGTAERFRLRCLAYALHSWNQNTGALSRLDIDPLPHQVSLVHHLLASGNLNWMIADDVGLGKTVEVGMLLHALNRSGSLRRALIVCPAGLTQQWQEELRDKFGLSDFLIFGRDFEPNHPDQWKIHSRVIASMDRLKQAYYMDSLEAAGTWDLVVFDEAHRLTRRLEGNTLRASERFQLAAFLRDWTDSLLLLTATPHQGREEQFQALLELLRPELTDEIRRLNAHPEILHDLVVRNPKSQVTDWEGNLIFKGKSVHAVQVPIRPEDEAFGRALESYFRQGYQASDGEDTRLRAIGFVMTVYRKLAASSLAAILGALERRLRRLTEGDNAPEPVHPMDEADARYEGEWDEARSNGGAFFAGEQELLVNLIRLARELLPGDMKLAAFLEKVVPAARATSPKLVIFTEYRSTQEYLVRALVTRYGESAVRVLHGSLNLDQRREAIKDFNEDADFLVSTEAGGEGINLHQRCHILVNYDLPWNPTRLVQRIGRLYRYGQQKPVFVFNLHAPQTLDARIVQEIYDRIQRIVNDLGVLGGEFRDGLEDEIFGQLAELVDLKQILERAIGTDRSEQETEIQAALSRARQAYAEQKDLFEYFTQTLQPGTTGDLVMTPRHLESFVTGMIDELGMEIAEARSGGQVLEVKLPDELAELLKYSSRRLQIAFRREDAYRPGIEVMDEDSRFLRYLLSQAQDWEFGGRIVGLSGLRSRALFGAFLRWQNDQGRRSRQEFALAEIEPTNSVRMNSDEASELLLESFSDAASPPAAAEGRELWGLAAVALEERLGEMANQDLHPQGLEISCAGLSGPS